MAERYIAHDAAEGDGPGHAEWAEAVRAAFVTLAEVAAATEQEKGNQGTCVK